MLSYRILAQDVPTTSSAVALQNGVVRLMDVLGRRALDIQTRFGHVSAMLTLDGSSLSGDSGTAANIAPDQIIGGNGHQDWQPGGQQPCSNGDEYRDKRNDFSSLTNEFTTGPIRWLGSEKRGIASCRPPS